MSSEIILKKIISADHIYGIKYYNNSLFLSNILDEYITKVEVYDNYKKEKLFDIKKGWKKFQFFKKNENNFKGIHSIQPLNNNLFFSISYLQKKLILFDLKNKKILNFPKINNYLKGPSHIDYIKKKSLLLISDYDGGEVYLFNYKKKYIQKISEISKVKFKKPHMTVFKKNNYYILDTKKRNIIILDDNFNKTKNLSKNNIKFNNFEKYKKNFLDIPVSIKVDVYKNIYISDVGKNNCIYVINKELSLIGIIKNKKIKFNKYSFYEKNLNLNKVYDLDINKDEIFIASTHSNKIFHLKNVFIEND
ncbi:hypothetical protein N9374_03285 [Candidatus Pelagibacter sp.]|nr:hypothetical protein [Candidatus Pelagibacter sp.]